MLFRPPFMLWDTKYLYAIYDVDHDEISHLIFQMLYGGI